MTLDALKFSGSAEQWLSLSEVARLKGIEKSSVSRRVKRLLEQDLLEVRSGEGGQKLVHLAAYERATAEVTDAVREANGSHRSSRKAGGGSGLAREQARRAALQADLAELELAERLALRLPVDGVTSVVRDASEHIVRRLEALPSLSDDLAAAAVKSGVKAVRAALLEYARDLAVMTCDVLSTVAPLGGKS